MKIRRSRKALSPVIASIILIAVTVAVSIAVAAWMGALTFSFMATEQGQVTNLTFTAGTPGTIVATFNNTGTNTITITTVWVNNVQITTANVAGAPVALNAAVPANSGTQYTITVTSGIVSGNQYAVTIMSSKGNKFSSTGNAPT
jgi:archaeal type IV pilus assembly protein PilA